MTTIKIETKACSIEFGVMSIPNRKSKCLYRMRGAMIEPLAYFRTDEDANTFNEIIEFILKVLDQKSKTDEELDTSVRLPLHWPEW